MKATAAGLLLAVVVAACGASGGGRRGTLVWKSCGGRLECATLAVPLDYAHPQARKLELALLRLPATDSKHRIGSLLVNPGGPGESGVAIVRSAGLLPFDPELLRRFDLVGFDPRGIGGSSPISCGENRDELLAVDPTPDNPAEIAAFAKADRALTAGCRARAGPVLPFLGTVNVARDLDRIRAALGEQKLTYLGFSYGTRLGSVYAQLFPARVRALVLDGGVHPTASAEQLSREAAAAAERALHRFFADCLTRGSCPLGPDPESAWRRLQRLAERAAPGAPSGLSAGILYRAAAVLLLDKNLGWPLLANALGAALDGNAAALRVAVELAYGDANENTLEAGVAVLCADEPERLTLHRFLTLERSLARRYPLIGFAATVGCSAGWPPAADPLPAVRAEGAPPILVVGTRYDPATPYSWSQALADALRSGVLLTYEGDGHTAFASGNRCIDRIVTRYLVDLDVPPEGTACRPE